MGDQGGIQFVEERRRVNVQPHARTKADAEFSAGNLGGFAPSDRDSGAQASPRGAAPRSFGAQ